MLKHLIFILFVVVFFMTTANSQTSSLAHTFEEVFYIHGAERIIAIVGPLEGNILSYYVAEKVEDGIFSLKIDSDTSIFEDKSVRLKKGEKFLPSGCFAIQYCKAHKIIFYLARVPCVEVKKE